ncbi:hypothetical protein QA649_02400 [Bradyrhizobium sp. CB1717]|uniref:hypothetical protein n=1 Tax=Bradyrhizobium sp. CB1717 TaxID=3039154 RepID=UPI0024B0A782|nr:hypothetical protein [Bradyrhizobium sp. CB1717]WFU25120.1 hypothetical protein QA649_02400 [Bradyrhizobium sp. CB1717]
MTLEFERSLRSKINYSPLFIQARVAAGGYVGFEQIEQSADLGVPVQTSSLVVAYLACNGKHCNAHDDKEEDHQGCHQIREGYPKWALGVILARSSTR